MRTENNYDRYTSGNKATLVKSGVDYFNALELLIQSATHELHLQVYIFEPDETGLRVKNALLKAASRNIEVFILADALGSSSFPEKWLHELETAGIHFRWFGPLFTGSRLHIGRRMHHKVAVADARLALVGGINIGNRYNHFKNKLPWLDYAVLVEGEISRQLHSFCSKKWKGMNLRFRRSAFKMIPFFQYDSFPENCRIRIRVNDRLRRRARIVYSYRNAIRDAKESIVIAGAYFLPGHTFIRLMKKAADQGVIIRVITSSRSDVWLARFGMQHLYRRLLRAGIQLFEYTPSAVHAKILVADKQFVTMGSYDLNQLSTFINLELNLDIDNKNFGHTVYQLLDNTIEKDCVQITTAILNTRENILNRFLQWFAFRMLRLLFILTLFTADKKAV